MKCNYHKPLQFSPNTADYAYVVGKREVQALKVYLNAMPKKEGHLFRKVYKDKNGNLRVSEQVYIN